MSTLVNLVGLNGGRLPDEKWDEYLVHEKQIPISSPNNKPRLRAGPDIRVAVFECYPMNKRLTQYVDWTYAQFLLARIRQRWPMTKRQHFLEPIARRFMFAQEPIGGALEEEVNDDVFYETTLCNFLTFDIDEGPENPNDPKVSIRRETSGHKSQAADVDV